MSDFPYARPLFPVISVLSELSCIGYETEFEASGGSPVSTTWPSANLGIFVPIVLPAPYLVKKVWWANGAAVAGNVDCGIYSNGGALLASAGSTAQSGTSTVQSVTLGTAILLTPGQYYLALSASSATAAFLASTTGAAYKQQRGGMAQQAAALALPASFTLATLTNDFIPVYGISSRTVI